MTSHDRGQKYVQSDATTKPTWYGHTFDASYYFTNEIHGACGTTLNANESIAVPESILNAPGGISCGAKYYIDIPGFENTIFKVQDSGSFVIDNGQPHFDIYVGAQTQYDYSHNHEFTKYDGLSFRVAPVGP